MHYINKNDVLKPIYNDENECINYKLSMSMADPIAFSVETLKINSGSSLEKEFNELIHMNP